MIIAIILTMLAFAYRFRGGGFFQTTDVVYRSVWSAALAVAVFAFTPGYEAVWAFPAAYASVQFIPHAFCQNMGRASTTWSVQGLKKYWPGAWLPQFTQAEYTGSLTVFDKTVFDFFGMASVGVIRGIIVFSGIAAISALTGTAPIDALSHFSHAVGVLVLGYPLAYLILWCVPWTLPSLGGHSTEWPEFGVGPVWGAAIIAYLA